MKSFRLLAIIAGILALAAQTACQQEEEDPFITVDGEKTVQLTEAQATVTLKVTSNRDWGVRMDSKAKDWVVVEPSSGQASKTPVDVTVTVLANTGANRSTTIEFYASTIAHEMVTIEQAGPKGDSDGIESVTVVDFISKADKTTYYRLTGTVSRFNSEFCSFDLTDDSGTIYVYSVAESSKAEWAGKIKNGGTVTLQGQYEYYASKSQHEVVNAIIESFTAGEEQTEITAATVSDFIKTASTTVYYRLTGTVSEFKTGTNSSGKNWMQFNLTDATGTILVYGFEDGQYDEWVSKIKDNGTITLVGLYQYYEKNSQHEVVSATIESFEEGEAPQAVNGTVAEAIAVADGTPVIIGASTVAAKSAVGVVVSDGTANVYIYFDTKAGETVPEVVAGDVVKVEATKTTYGGVPELKTATVTKLSEGTITYPEPKDLNPIVTTYESNVTEYVCLTGKLAISGNYYNVEIPGVTEKVGSISSPLESMGVAALDGKDVTVTGYFSGMTGSGKYINIVAVSVAPADPNAKYCAVNPTAINVKADATSATFEVTANAAWTASSDNADFAVAPASGDADAVVTVTFPANTGDAAKVANIKVTCAAAGVEAVVTITQAKPASANQTVVSVDFTPVIDALPQGSSAALTDGTYTLDGQQFIFHAADKFYQAKNGDLFYLLIGKKDSYVQLPAIAGKALVKVAFLTGAGASENVILDVAKEDGTLLNINTAKLKKGTEYEWEVPGEAGKAYRLVVTNAYNAQFQTLTLTYE